MSVVLDNCHDLELNPAPAPDVPLRTPKVSVCIPAYNYGRYLKNCLASVFAQTYQDFEIVLVDNASTDDTAEVARSFDDPRLRYFRNHSTVSAVENHNKAFGLARGEYIALLAADDEFMPNRLLRGVEALDANPSVGLAYSAFVIMDSEGSHINTERHLLQDSVSLGKDEFASLIQENHIACPTVIFRNRLCREVGGFRKVGYSPDWDMWLRCTFQANVAYIAEPLARYRVHDKNETTSYSRSGQADFDLAFTVQSAFLELPADFNDLMHLRQSVLPRYLLAAAWRTFELGDVDGTREYMQDSIEADSTLLGNSDKIIESIIWFSTKRLLPTTDPLQFAESLCRWLASSWPEYRSILSWFRLAFAAPLTRNWKSYLLSEINARFLFAAHERHSSASVRRIVPLLAYRDPTYLHNLGFWSIGIEAFFGPLAANYMRRLSRNARRIVPDWKS